MNRHQLSMPSHHMLSNTAKQAPMLSAELERQLARKARRGSEQAFGMLVNAHLRLVLNIASDFASYGVSMDDLVSEGLLGLVEATRRFDSERGVRLATYAVWWIRAYMRRFSIQNRRIVRAPSSRSGRKLLANLRNTQKALMQATGERPDNQTVAEVLHVTRRDVDEMESALSGHDVPWGVDADGRGVELPGAIPSPEAQYERAEEQGWAAQVVKTTLRHLNVRERYILKQRYLVPEKHSLATIGRSMGISRERVRQLQNEAQSKMRDTVLQSVA